ncbi:uncharacterized protein LOC121913180 isoform X2 [Thunnus maccoyii]|uniref:uncharacterized protein LOC121913180 isoform X2 n=1 Tax=Thunnus maccoyii TaxID=8240 RepID=UPI001C4CEC50|nr:uncharacterized protein LOC121913180 isoform X2 [Thunnus maccoyii]
MSRFQELKDLFKQRLINAARGDLFGHFERSISGVEKEIDHKRKLLDMVLNPDMKLQRAERPAHVQQPLESKEEVPPEQQEWSSSLDQEDPEPPHIKEEQEELWTSQEGEQLLGLEDTDVIKVKLTPVPVKSEDDEEKPQSSKLHQRQTEQMRTEADGEDCGGSEPARNSHLDQPLQPDTDDKTSDSSEPDTDDSDFWTQTRQSQSDLNSMKNKGSQNDIERDADMASESFNPHSDDSVDSDFWKDTRGLFQKAGSAN